MSKRTHSCVQSWMQGVFGSAFLIPRREARMTRMSSSESITWWLRQHRQQFSVGDHQSPAKLVFLEQRCKRLC